MSESAEQPQPSAAAPHFAPGDRVRTRAVDPDRHTRLPAYARGRTGRVLAVTGCWPLADDVAQRCAEPRVEPVYTVAFAARDLWGEGAHEVTLDLWQSYLEPTSSAGRAETADPSDPVEEAST
ncbi:SH3-like domain-containing protein [Streptomyces albidus (ex Kaewkla and Franco 2022)]|uniref:SH3-like domain-containing protein n=1 Tax=Streptomyces albidus (ex Kaewkla and Franco 2022) TaxID=722709 RepID=UPI0015EF9D29|nr:SH3-like domain-containing protein [Streptomyces albidus (ex Kaewkla and Franco 2022)]